MKCQILFWGKNKKNILHLSSPELAQRVATVKCLNGMRWPNIFCGPNPAPRPSPPAGTLLGAPVLSFP